MSAQELSTNIIATIHHKIVSDGFNLDCTQEEKLIYIWKLYQQAVETEDHLRQSHSKEMEEVDHYVEHIRHLSEEREVVVQELETENEQLKLEIEKLQENSSTDTKDMLQMLSHQGLSEISDYSSTEQIAYLLAERAHLLDELEAIQTKKQADGQKDIQKLLEQERMDFEEEFKQQHEKFQQMKEKMKLDYEEEVSVLIDENDRLSKEITEIQKKIFEYKQETMTLRTALQTTGHETETVNTDLQHNNSKHSSQRRSSDLALRKVIEEKTKVESEIVVLKRKIKSLELENKSLQMKVEKIEAEAQKERDIQQQLRTKNVKVEAALEEAEQQVEDLEKVVEDLRKEKTFLSDQLKDMKKDANAAQTQQRHMESLKDIIDILNNEKKSLVETVETLRKELDEEKVNHDNLLHEKLQHSKDEMVLSSQVDDYRKEMNQLKMETEQLKNNYEKVEKEYSLCCNKIESLQMDLKNMKNEKNELCQKLEALAGEHSKTKLQLETAGTDLEKSRLELQEKVKHEKNLEKSNEVQKRVKEVDSLKSKLQLTLEELSKVRLLLDQEKQEQEAVVMKLEKTERLAEEKKFEAKTEKETLQNKVNSLENKMKLLKDELFDAQEEIRTLQETYAKDMETAEKEKNVKGIRLNLEIQDIEKKKSKLEWKMAAEMKEIGQENRELKDKLSETVQTKKNIEQKLVMTLELMEKLKQEKNYTDNRQVDFMMEQKPGIEDEDGEPGIQLQTGTGRKNLVVLDGEMTRDKQIRDTCEDKRTNHKEESVKKMFMEQKENLRLQVESEELLATQAEYDMIQLRKEKEKLENSHCQFQREQSQMKNQLSDLQQQLEREKSVSAQQLAKTEESQSIQEQKYDRLFQQLLDEKQHAAELQTNLEEMYKELEREKIHAAQMESGSNQLEQLTALQDGLERERSQSAKLERQLQLQVEREKLHTCQLQQTKEQLDRLCQQLEKENLQVVLVEELTEMKKQLEKMIQQFQKEKLWTMQNSSNMAIITYENDISQTKLDVEKLETQLQVETRLRSLLENKITALTQEITQAYDDLKSQVENNIALENSNKNLEEELEKKSLSSRQVEELFSQKSANQDLAVKSAKARADLAEQKMEQVHLDQEEVSSLLQGCELELAELRPVKSQLQEKRNALTHLKIKFQQETLHSALLQKSVEQLKRELNCMKNSNKLLDFNNSSDLSDAGKIPLAEQMSQFQQEIKDLQYELLTVNERREMQEKRYEDKKLRIRTKFLRSREVYNEERSRLQEQLMHMGEDLQVARSMLTKEHESREKLESSLNRLVEERRDLFSKTAEQEEIIREKTRILSMLEVRSKFLEDENKRLQEKIVSLNQRQSILQRTNQKSIFPHQMPKDSSPSFSSVFTSSPRGKTVSPQISSLKGGNVSHHSSLCAAHYSVDSYLHNFDVSDNYNV